MVYNPPKKPLKAQETPLKKLTWGTCSREPYLEAKYPDIDISETGKEVELLDKVVEAADNTATSAF